MRFNYKDSFFLYVYDDNEGYGMIGHDVKIKVEWFENSHICVKRILVGSNWFGRGERVYGWVWNKKYNEDCDSNVYRLLRKRYDYENTLKILKNCKIFN